LWKGSPTSKSPEKEDFCSRTKKIDHSHHINPSTQNYPEARSIRYSQKSRNHIILDFFCYYASLLMPNIALGGAKGWFWVGGVW
jgi:hypothetical protein